MVPEAVFRHVTAKKLKEKKTAYDRQRSKRKIKPVSMSTYVKGFAPADETWQKMKDIWDACVAAQVRIPEAVDDFFDGEPPDPRGVEVGLPAREWRDGDREGYELDVADIPPHVTILRFYNAW